MRLVPGALALVLALSVEVSAEEILVLADGSRMPVASYEVQGTVVVIRTTEGKLRSFPASYVDLEAMRAASPAPSAPAPAPAASPVSAPSIAPPSTPTTLTGDLDPLPDVSVPRDHEARLRWAVEHFGLRELLEMFALGIESGMKGGADSLPPELEEALRQAFREPFAAGPFFDRVQSELLERADGRSVDAWLGWLDSPSARKVIAREAWSRVLNAPHAEDGASRVRESQVRRLLEAGYPASGWYEAFGEAVTEMVQGMRTGASEEVGSLFGAADWSKLDAREESMVAEVEAALHHAYASLTDAELEPYVRFWESPDGRGVGAALRDALSVTYREAGGEAGTRVAQVFQGYFGVEPPKAETLRFAERNFQFTAPAVDWAPLDVERFNTRAVIGYIRRNPQVVFMIVSEHDASLAGISSEAATAVARANLEAGSKDYRFLSEKPWPVGPLNGVLMSSESVIAGRPALYVHWVYSSNGSVYQLIAWGAKTEVDLESLTVEADRLFQGFRLLQSSSPTTVAATGELADVHSERYGYSMRLSGASWTPWDDLEESAPEADLGGLRGSSAFLIVPVAFGDLDPSLDALTAALLKRLDIDASSIAADASRDLGDALRRGRTVDFRRNVNETDYTYRFHVWKGGHLGYLVAAWTSEGPVASLDPVLSRFDFDPEHAAPAVSSLSDREKTWQGVILHDLGLDYFERDQFGLAAGYFRAASDLSPGDSEAFLYLLTALSFTSRFEEALELLDIRGAAFPDNAAVQSYRPFLLAKLGRGDEAATLYRELFASGYQNDSDLWDYANLLVDLERADEALAEVVGYRKDRDSVSAARLEAVLHHRAERYDRAIDVLERELVAYPGEADVALDLLDAYFDAGRYREAVDKAAELASKSGAPGPLYLRSGQARIALGQLSEAKASFVAALEADPKNGEAREYLDYVSGLLGQGDHELARRPVEAVPLPSSLGAPPEPTAAFAEASGDYGAYYLDRSTAIAFRPGEDYRRTDRYVVSLTDQKAIAAFSSFEFELDPRTERLFVNELLVTDAEGRTVAEGDLSSFYVTDDTSDGMASSDKLLNVPVPGLSVGHTISLTVTLERLSPPRKMPFVRHTFSSGFPAVRSSLFVSGELDAVRYESAGAKPDTAIPEGVLWTVETPALFRTEDYSESVERYLPFVWLGSSGESWEAIGREYLADIGERLGVDAATRALALELTSGQPSREAKIEALADYVQASLTYKAIEFGRRAWLPSPAGQIVGNRYGDCKDHATLFYVLLEALDEPAELVLVSTNTEIQPAVPSMDQFNHMIVYVPGYDGGHFFDLTDKNHDVAALPPLGLGGRSALLLAPESPRLVVIPEYPDDSSRARALRTLTVDGEDLLVSEEISFEGYYSAWMRSGFKSSDAASRRERVLRYLDTGRRVTVEELEIDNLADPKKLLVFHLRYRLHGVLHEADDKLIGRIPAAWEKTLLEVPWEPDRRTPYRVAYPLSVESEVRVALPEGYVLASEVRSLEATDPKLVRWRVSTERSQNELIVHLESLRPQVRGPASEYQELVTTVSSFLDAAEPSLVLARR